MRHGLVIKEVVMKMENGLREKASGELKPALLWREIAWVEPDQVAAILRDEPQLTFLDSSMGHERLGRYSYIAIKPRATLMAADGRVTLDGVVQPTDAFTVLEEILAQEKRIMIAELPPFQGGLAGYIAYDYGRQLERQAQIKAYPALCPDIILHIYDQLFSFDHGARRAFILAPSEREIDGLAALLERPMRALGGSAISAGWQANFTAQSYRDMVARTVEYVLAGDIFQANMAQCFTAPLPPGFDAFAFYSKLRQINPAPFSAFLDYGAVKIASSSPERLFLKHDDKIEARPIKGTRKRDSDPERDQALQLELLNSPKDRAENIMIVDLLRNDLSRVCQPHSVLVPVLCGLESYASLHHLTSVVTGEMRETCGVSDLLRAVFPGGSITGAPKIRAMEIIAELEGRPRGVYCGSIGYFAFNGQIDLNIAIRTVLFSQGLAMVYGGGGITARSEPQAEYDESLLKMARLMEAFAP